MLKHIASHKSNSEITNCHPDMDVQPNAVDLRLDKVFKIHDSTFVLDETRKQHRNTAEIAPADDEYFHLEAGVYEISFANEVTVGDHEAGWVVPRSTLIRNGIFIVSGLYDSGYSGKMGACLHIHCGPAKIRKGARIGQYICVHAEELHKYDGDYGTGKVYDAKYES